jgi:hypothetical protein
MANWLFVKQSFSVGFLKADYCPFTVRQKARVVPVVEFREIQRQVLLADMMESSDHAAF